MAVPLELLFALVPGLILFLYGIENFSKEIMNVAGSRFRETLAKLTKSHWRGAGFGALLTALIQSSTATTVIVVGLVNAGTLSFAQSLGVIIGANVGTTVTAQLIAFKLTAFSPVFILGGFVLGLVGGKYKVLGKPLFYFGLVFFSLTLVSSGIEPLKTDPGLLSLLSSLDNFFIALLIGIGFTVLVQSSSVTSGFMVVLAMNGLVSLEQAIPVLLGAKIGTTSTGLLASANMGLFAKRAAVAHLLFNVGGVLLFIPFVGVLESTAVAIGGDVAQQVANAYMIYAAVTALVFLVLIRPFQRLVEMAVPGDEKEVLFRTEHLPKELPPGDDESIQLIQKEMGHSIDVTTQLFDAAMETIGGGPKGSLQKVAKLEALNDYLDEEIENAIRQLSRRALDDKGASLTIHLVRMSNLNERLGDLAEDLSGEAVKISSTGGRLQELLEDIKGSYSIFRNNLQLLKDALEDCTDLQARLIKANTDALTMRINNSYERHLRWMVTDTELSDSAFLEMLTTIEAANRGVRELAELAQTYSALRLGACVQGAIAPSDDALAPSVEGGSAKGTPMSPP